MADTINNKPKLQLGSGFVRNGPGSPITPTKLLINHGKPNFTIQRSPKMDENRKFSNDTKTNKNIISTTNGIQNNDNNNVIKSTKFFGVLSNATREKTPEINDNDGENESANKVMLRRTPTIAPVQKNEDDANVPEFILRQRAIQERLAKENVLDFDKRRSGYFTHVLISPTSNNRTSFAETMSSPAINPAMEIPAPTFENTVQENSITEHKDEENNDKIIVNENQTEIKSHELNMHDLVTINEHEKHEKNEEISHEVVEVEKIINNGHVDHDVDHDDDDEVANAIEEVNKAIAGEDSIIVEDTENRKSVNDNDSSNHVNAIIENNEELNQHVAQVHAHEVKVDVNEVIENDTPKQKDHEIDENNNNESGGEITISHTNGIEGPHIPSDDPSGALGVNYEPKTVVSFSKELGSVENKYPDTVSFEVKVKSPEEIEQDNELKELTKVKFDITTTNENDIDVIPVIKIESV